MPILLSPTSKALAAAICVGLAALLIGISYFFAGTEDYSIHYRFASAIKNGASPDVPHILYHVLIAAANSLIPVEARLLSTSLIVVFRATLAVVLFVNIRAWVSKRVPDNWLALVVIALLFSAPIYLWFNPPNFLGYVNYLPYHSPTQNLLLVFVVPVTLAAQRAIVPQPLRDAHIRFVFIMTSAIPVVLMTLSKPSYSIALLPALALVALYRVVRRLPVDWSALVFGLGLPSLLTLALQYLVTYTASQAAAIEIGWLVFFRFYGLQWWDVAARLVLSALFPLTVYCLYFKEAAKDDLLNFSWIIFGISLVWSYFFYESGARLGHGNFTWSASAALFVLMVSSIIFLLRNETFSTFSPRLKAAVAILAFHVISGVAAPSAILLSAFIARLSG